MCSVVKDWEMFRSGRNFIPKCQLDTPRTERIFQNGPKSSRFNLTGKLCNILCISPFYMCCALYRSGMSILCEEVGSKLIMYVHSYCHTEWTYELNWNWDAVRKNLWNVTAKVMKFLHWIVLPEKGNTAVDVIWPFEILGRELEVFRDKKVALLCRPSSGNTKFWMLCTTRTFDTDWLSCNWKLILLEI